MAEESDNYVAHPISTTDRAAGVSPGRHRQEACQLRHEIRFPTSPPLRRRRDERGSASAELVVATPLLLLLILGIVQFAVWEHATHVAQAIAQQGLAAGRVQGGSEQAATAEATSVLDQLGSGVLVHPSISATRGADSTTVIVTERFTATVGQGP
jgi:Flp pilus assembly protein TadG